MHKKILIIGAGQLGSRHLQGALLSVNALDIIVIDPSENSLNVCRERAEQVTAGHPNTRITYQCYMPSDLQIDVCIISTAARYRAQVTRQLLSHNVVKYIIFEKVLFQALSEYDEIGTLLTSNVTKGWVNCPRRLFPTYVSIETQLDTSIPIDMCVKGNAWGMACNSVHFIDLFAFLIHQSDMSVKDSQLVPEVIESKRPGYLEIAGKLTFVAGKHSLVVESGTEETPELVITLSNGDVTHTINEIKGSWTEKVGDTITEHTHTALFQSQLTGMCIDEIINTDFCNLTPYAESCEIHTPFIATLIEHISLILNKKIDVCPIT
ncbi:Gfo/Idh/MocA family oxidoreductase [Paraperlucidibaca wandonensis]|uniref:Gfo/Idh/MocA family oxidoreductase n=1 Tax=Paraperlucidibaca wandonensis TaxID=1268273 RepID=A0ABW3HF44_9GAMM